jgi:histidyl-tRNA synthetase
MTPQKKVYPATSTFIKTAADVAEHFGFKPLEECFKGLERTKVQTDPVEIVHSFEQNAVAAGKLLAERHKHTKTDHVLGYLINAKTNGDTTKTTVSLHIAGSKKPMAEATLIAVARAILLELGVENPMVHFNGIGNTEAGSRYTKDLLQFLKRTLPTTDPKKISEASQHPRKVFSELVRKNEPSVAGAPNPIDYLNDESRTHVWSVLEYLEASQIPYTLDPTLIGSPDIWEQDMYAIHGDRGDGDETLAVGGRYSMLTRRSHKQYVDVAGITISSETKGPLKDLPHGRKKQPHIYFAHISDAARKIAISALHQLREMQVPVSHAFTRDTLTDQMKHVGSAEYVVIIGHKEALDKTAIVRNIKTRAQKEVPMRELGSYLKRL